MVKVRVAGWEVDGRRYWEMDPRKKPVTEEVEDIPLRCHTRLLRVGSSGVGYYPTMLREQGVRPQM